MMFGKSLFTILLLVTLCAVQAQEIPVNYNLGENYSDRYKYSTVLSITDNGTEGTVLVRKYYGGMVIRPKGHFIEVYDKDLNLISDYNYKYSGEHMVDGFVKNGKLVLLELAYNYDRKTYEYIAHETSLSDFNFSEKVILSVSSKEVINPLAVNKFNRNFSNGFSTTVFFNDEKSAFAISIHHRLGKKQTYKLHLFGIDLKERINYDFTGQIEEKNYAFENIAVSHNLESFYLMGKAYFKKRRFEAKERRFQYELVRISKEGHTVQEFNDPGRFPESLKPILTDNQLIAVGFYADRKDNRYNGLVYFKMDAKTLDIQSKKYNAFSEEFMLDKFGREVDAEIKNLVFKDIHITPNKGIIFSAEEYFVTKGEDRSATGSQVRIDRYHYNDIVCAKLDADGTMAWARNINKTEVTQGDAAYASYTAYGKDNDMYFFMNSGENPQKLSRERMLFKQGYSRNPNMFVIKLDAEGKMSYKKLIDDKEVRLPIMVSKPLINKSEDELLFYAKRGSKKQLVKVSIL
ncbi:MAG: hypothetical protein AAFZ89_05805 [Bacteroidota bacterium]